MGEQFKMARICEKIIYTFSVILFGDKMEEKECEKEHNVEYTLSSVFPTAKIMHEVKKHI